MVLALCCQHVYSMPGIDDVLEALDNTLMARNPGSDPSDYSWIRTWTSVGDSYSAGIGSGNVLSGSPNDRQGKSDIDCSRYDYSWPSIMNRFFGQSVQSFSYQACSGARSIDIYQQIQNIPSASQDLISITAGKFVPLKAQVVVAEALIRQHRRKRSLSIKFDSSMRTVSLCHIWWMFFCHRNCSRGYR